MNINKIRNIYSILDGFIFSEGLKKALSDEISAEFKHINFLKYELKEYLEKMQCYNYKQNKKLPYLEELTFFYGDWYTLFLDDLYLNGIHIKPFQKKISYMLQSLPFLDEIKKKKLLISYLDYKKLSPKKYITDLNRKWKHIHPIFLDELKKTLHKIEKGIYYLYETQTQIKSKKISYVLHDYPFLDEIKKSTGNLNLVGKLSKLLWMIFP